MARTYRIRDLEQVRLLADPFRLRLLLAFAAAPRTATQVAAELGENVTRLYRHVDALSDAGLLEVVAERQKRGTMERTFRAVAERFEADRALFAGEDDETGAMRTALDESVHEIIQALTTVREGDETPIVLRMRCKASAARIAELRRALCDWVEAAEADDPHAGGDLAEAGALIAFYPLRPEG